MVDFVEKSALFLLFWLIFYEKWLKMMKIRLVSYLSRHSKILTKLNLRYGFETNSGVD
jgi:hypothetical protein